MLTVLQSFQSFTHVDPFEDTESAEGNEIQPPVGGVSPTSIRSRILKAIWAPILFPARKSFTHVDPFEDTERRCRIQHYPKPIEFHPRRSVRGY